MDKRNNKTVTARLLPRYVGGIPCIATLVTCIPEIFDGDKYGFTVPSKDENRLVEKMVMVAKMPEKQRKVLIDRAKQQVRVDYSHEVVIERLEHIYEKEIGIHREAK